MRRFLGTTALISIVVALLLASVATAFLVWERSQDDQKLLSDLEQQIKHDFGSMVDETSIASAQIAASYAKTHSLGPSDGNVRLALDAQCQLVDWNNSELMPSPRIMDDLCEYPLRRSLQDKNKIYYYLRNEAPPFHIVTLIPVSIDYKVSNAFLPRKVFLGRYSNETAVKAASDKFEVHLRQVDGGIRLFDGGDNFVYCITVPDLSIFLQSTRLLIVLLYSGAFIAMMIGVFVSAAVCVSVGVEV